MYHLKYDDTMDAKYGESRKWGKMLKESEYSCPGILSGRQVDTTLIDVHKIFKVCEPSSWPPTEASLKVKASLLFNAHSSVHC